MLLLVDAGNTRIKWALVDRSAAEQTPGKWLQHGSVARAEAGSLIEAWRGFSIGRVLLSNVAGHELRGELERVVLHTLGTRPVALEWFTSAAELGGVKNLYLNPAQLGADRFAAAIGAHALFPARPLVVATCGTATTVDALSAQGEFIGGMILPQLPQVALHSSMTQPFADNTDAAIVSGCLAAQAGAIERAVAAQMRIYPHLPIPCILAGGAADLIAPHLTVDYTRVDNLVLIGLHTVAIQHTSPC
jgi:type III pantothenate kinase